MNIAFIDSSYSSETCKWELACNIQEKIGTPKTLRKRGRIWERITRTPVRSPSNFRELPEDRMLLKYGESIGKRRNVSIDLGLINIAVFSDGTVYLNGH